MLTLVKAMTTLATVSLTEMKALALSYFPFVVPSSIYMAEKW